MFCVLLHSIVCDKTGFSDMARGRRKGAHTIGFKACLVGGCAWSSLADIRSRQFLRSCVY